MHRLKSFGAMVLAVGVLALPLGACGDDDGGQNNGNANGAVCGNGVLDPGEQCDNGAANSDTDPDACRSNCREAGCGDGVIDTGEACEDGNLAGATCDGQGFTAGTLVCDAQCQLDTGGCTRCGDGVAGGTEGAPGYESCDGTDLRNETCTSQGRALGVLGCNADCTFDHVLCTGALPVITGIEGTGSQATIAPRTEDASVFDYTANKRLASRRVHGQQRVLEVSGDNLAGTVTAQAVGQDGQGTIDFEIEPGGTNTMVRLRFPQTLAVTRGGLFLLTLVSAYGPAQAQVFFLQGEPGQCSNTVTGDLTVTGRITAGGPIQAGAPAECPGGYTRDVAATDIVLCANASSGDEMVRVGDFWVDRYEMSMWSAADCSATQYGVSADDYPAAFPDNGNWSTAVYACSVTGVMPSRHMTWFQAQAACAASGKHLCTNAEWQAAAEGTHDPGANSSANLCNTDSSGARTTGAAGGTPGGNNSCISIWGAEDMVGNFWEMTSNWWQAGHHWTTSAGPNEMAGVWGAAYGDDSTWGLNGNSWHSDQTHYTNGIPAAAHRGGRWDSGSKAGVFTTYLLEGPSYAGPNHGARCCLSR